MKSDTPEEAVVDMELAPGLAATRVRRQDDTALVLRGEIDVSCAGPLLGWLLHETADGDGPIVLDLAEVSFIDSSGVAALLNGHRAARTRMRIGPMHPTVRRVLEIAAVIDQLAFETPAHDGDEAAGQG